MPRRQVRNIATDLGDLTEKNVGLLKLFNSTVFPVKYPIEFYTNLLNNNATFTKLAYYGSDLLVGAVCFKIEKNDKLYIMTLGVLEKYQNMGIGSKLLNYILEEIVPSKKITEIYLHVQVDSPALEFYKKYGFEVGEKIENYYHKVEPTSAHIVRKTFNHNNNN